ncbi:MAG: MerR family transcriptional regulator [Eubacteriales bacterium]
MNIQEVAAMMHLTKRTLHHYDEIGLLCPKRKDSSGYRDYSKEDLARLEQILLYREMDFSLSDIAKLLESQPDELGWMMEKHKAGLSVKRDRLNRILDWIEKRMQGEEKMDFEAFDKKDIEKAKQNYSAETKERWGTTDAYKQSQTRTERYTKEDWAKISAEASLIYRKFYDLKSLAAADEKRLALAEAWRQHISQYYYDCTYEILGGLGEMYIADERFTQTIDKVGEGTAKAMSESIKVLCEQKINNH